MKLGRLIWFVVVGMLLAIPTIASAQESTLTGTVRDNTGGVLPGVTVTATNEAAGTQFVGVTDESGIYRIPVRPGVYRITAELAGFNTVARPGVELLLGRTIALNLDMQVSGLQETVTVTGEAPLLDVTSSDIAGNIDPRQMQELPLNGRNWMDLTLLAPGARSNAGGEVPMDRQGFFQINVDGQPVTLTVCCAQNQPRYSRDSIAEFEITTNRFDATKGRTMGMMVNAITKSGTNTPSGTFSGFFRDDALNAADFIQDRVIPYQNQQLSGTFGGPIIRDRVHFFFNWEYEREPGTITFNNAQFPSFNIDLPSTRTENKGGLKGDVQFNPQNRMWLRWNMYRNKIPHSGTGGAGNHPSTSSQNNRQSYQIFADYTSVLSARTVNQIKGGVIENFFTLEPNAGYSSTPNRRPPYAPDIFVGVDSALQGTGRAIQGGTPRIGFSGYNLGSAGNTPQRTGEKNYSIRDDLTTSYTAMGRHDLSLGAEFIYYTMPQNWCNLCDGQFSSNQRPPANLEQLLPVWDDVSSWNLDALSPLMRDFTISIGNFRWRLKRQIFAGWLQDDWRATDNLTLNLGVRWDLDFNVHGEREVFEPWLSGNRPRELDNVAPRLGFAYSANDRTVVRGGYGLFFTQLENDGLHQSHLPSQHTGITILNDGRPDFMSNPFNGPVPTYEQALSRLCSAPEQAATFAAWQASGFSGTAPCLSRSVTIEIPMGPHDTSYSHMASIGFQRQIGEAMAYESNVVLQLGRKEERRSNINLSYNPDTGANYRFQDIGRRPFPQWGVILGEFMDGKSEYRGWENSFTKRFSDRWQANATYTLSWFWDDGGIGGPAGPYNIVVNPGADIPTEAVPVGFPVAADLRPDWALATEDQRHRATLNGIWDMGKGFQVSGLYFFGSGQRFNTTWGGDQRNVGSGGTGRLRPDGTIVPRNDFVGEPIHRIDLRVTKRQQIFGRATIDGMFEVFNLFNHENFGSYTTQQSNANYGQPSFNDNVAFQPRIVQLGFRLAF
jgi:hypothetical protein